MAKFTKRYKANDALVNLIMALKSARKSAGYTQEQMGKLIGISRETIIHIEGASETSVLSLQCEVIKRWHQICFSKLGKADQELVYQAIYNYMFGDLFTTSNHTDIDHQSKINSQSYSTDQRHLMDMSDPTMCQSNSQQSNSQQKNLKQQKSKQQKSKQQKSKQQKSKQQIKAA